MPTLEELKNAIIEMEPEIAVDLTNRAVSEGMSAMEIVNGGLIPGIEIVGERFKNFEYFLPEVITAAKAFKDSFEVIMPQLVKDGYEPKGRILIGTVEGDNHDIGKSIVIALLQGNGYEVIDAGVDVTPAAFIELINQHKPNIIGMSALLTTTMAKMRDTISALKAAGMRDNVKVIVGGSCVNKEFAESIDADGYGEDASDAVDLVGRLLAS